MKQNYIIAVETNKFHRLHVCVDRNPVNGELTITEFVPVKGSNVTKEQRELLKGTVYYNRLEVRKDVANAMLLTSKVIKESRAISPAHIRIGLPDVIGLNRVINEQGLTDMSSLYFFQLPDSKEIHVKSIELDTFHYLIPEKGYERLNLTTH